MDIRPLRAADAEAFWRLRLEALETEPYAFGEAIEEHRAHSLDRIAERLDRPYDDQFVLGAFVHGTLVGTVGYFRDKGIKRRHKAHLWTVYVTPSSRGQGVARALLTDVIDRLQRMEGLEQVALSVSASQNTARQLYLSLGFREFGLEPNALRCGSDSVDEHFLFLRLHP